MQVHKCNNLELLEELEKIPWLATFLISWVFFEKSDKRVPLLFFQRSDVGVALLFLGRERERPSFPPLYLFYFFSFFFWRSCFLLERVEEISSTKRLVRRNGTFVKVHIFWESHKCLSYVESNLRWGFRKILFSEYMNFKNV